MVTATWDESDERWAAARERGRARIDRLLDALCSELGFCLSPDARHALHQDPLTDIGALTTRAMAAEGLDDRGVLYEQTRAAVAAVLDEVTFLRVAWPEGEAIAYVEVSSSTDPIHTAHVAGSFDPGPGWPRLNVELQRAQEYLAEGNWGGARTASEAIDHLGICAVDELGRGYRLFDLQFRPGLLFGAARDGW